MKKLTLITLILNLLCTFLWADRKGRIFYYHAPKDAPKTAWIMAKGLNEPIEIILTDKQFSPTFNLPLKTDVLYFLPVGIKTPIDEEVLEKAPKIRLRESDQEIAFIAFHTPKNTVFPIRVEKVVANKAFDQGDFLFANFSKKVILGSLEEKKFTLKPKKTAIIKKPGKHLSGLQLKLDKVVDYNGKKKVAKFARNIWRQNDKLRYITFIDTKNLRGDLTYYSIPISFP